MANLGVDRTSVSCCARRILTDRDPAVDRDAVWLAILALIYAGDIEVAAAHCAQLEFSPRWAQSPRHRQRLAYLQARTAMLTGDSARSARLLGQLLAEKPSRLPTHLVVACSVEALVLSGDFVRAERILADYGLTGRLTADCPDLPHVLAARGTLYLAVGRFQQSVDDFVACGRVLTEKKVFSPAVIPWRSRAAHGAVRAGHVDLAVALAEDELLAARRWGSLRAIGTALHATAVVRRDSPTRLADAVELLELAGAKDDLLEALYALSARYAERDEYLESRRMLQRAGAVARTIRNRYWSQRIESGLARMAAPDTTGTLTRQEDKVARLARAGHSNRRIAEELFVTVRTVEFHLSGVYRKLGISGRRELAGALGVTEL
ncbi:LuxR C-terminal-related transcriptional regulator [Nocardia sp. NPDC003963]